MFYLLKKIQKMRLSRIKKYFKSIVCQDVVLCCHTRNAVECPSFKSGKCTSFSLQDQNRYSSSSPAISSKGVLSLGNGKASSSISARDLDLCGLLVCWHFLNQRGCPSSLEGQDSQSSLLRAPMRQSNGQKQKNRIQVQAVLRGKLLEMAVEKWNLFILPRLFEKAKQSTNKVAFVDGVCSSVIFPFPQLCVASSRTARMDGISFYLSSALYKSKSFSKVCKPLTSLYSLACKTECSKTESFARCPNDSSYKAYLTKDALWSQKVRLPRESESKARVFSNNLLKEEAFIQPTSLALPFAVSSQECALRYQNRSRCKIEEFSSTPHRYAKQVHCEKNDLDRKISLRLSRENNLVPYRSSLYLSCPNLLSIPEMQDLAQSGSVLLEGSMHFMLTCYKSCTKV
jgi:hypothetical protein